MGITIIINYVFSSVTSSIRFSLEKFFKKNENPMISKNTNEQSNIDIVSPGYHKIYPQYSYKYKHKTTIIPLP